MRYIGTAHIREMTREQWEQAGVNGQESLYFHKANGWTVPASKVTDEAMTYIMADPELFVLYEDPEGDVLRTLPDSPNAMTDRAPTGAALSGDGVEQVYEVPMAPYKPTEDTATAGERPDAPSGATSGGNVPSGVSSGSTGLSTPSAGGPVGGSTANTGT